MGNNCAPSWGRQQEGNLDSLSGSRGMNKSMGQQSDTSTVYKSDILSEPPDMVRIEEVEESLNRAGKNVKKSGQDAKSADKTKLQPVVEEKNKKQQIVKRMVIAGLEAEYILRKKTVHVKEHFNLTRKLGDGQYGTTYCCVEKSTGKEYACKSILKQKLVTEEDINLFRREIEIMRELSANPNVILIKDSYEDAQAVHIIMELCTGGEFLDRIVKLGHFTERKAAELVRIIVGVVQSCHSLGIMHRDLKPESFLYVNEGDDSPLKTIDFGLSVFFEPGKLLTDLVGSPYYVAPEVLQKSYGPEADIWSAGVITCIILSGSPPFNGEIQEEIFEEILHGEIDFLSDPWPTVSDSAKDLVKRMLIRDPQKRLTATEILCHPWVRVDGADPDKKMDSAVFSRLMQFSHKEKLKRMALRVITENLSEEEISGLQEIFKMIDTDDSSQITLEELKDGMKRFGANLDEFQMKSLMRAVEFDNNGTVDYQGFIGSMLRLHKIEKDDLLQAAFSYLDKDGNGYISRDELQKACRQFGVDAAGLEEIIQEADQNQDGHIDYQEFVTALQKGHIDLDKRLQDGSSIRNGGPTPVC